MAQYARQARKENFKGLFAVVSDPVDPLAKTAWLESNKDDSGVLDYQGLRPEQVHGFGLGVMNARAAYFAKRDERFKRFLTEGRSFGPHGQDLVVADSITDYNDELSKELTELTVTANLHMRAIGFKPFIALLIPREPFPGSDDARRMALRLRLPWRDLYGCKEPVYRIRP